MCTSFSFCFVFFKGGRGNEKKKMDIIDSESLNLLPASDFFFRITIKEKKDRDYVLAVTEEERLFLFKHEILNDLL